MRRAVRGVALRDGSTFLKEMYRVLKPGGVLRVTTPDLEKYLMGYVHRKTDPFLQEHAARFPPYTAATVVNNIFRNYEHRWVYDFEEFAAVAVHAGIPREVRVPRGARGARARGVTGGLLRALTLALARGCVIVWCAGGEQVDAHGRRPPALFPRGGQARRDGGHGAQAARRAREPHPLLARAGGARA